MNLPTTHQMAVAGTVIGSSAASVIATLGFVHLLSPADANNATAAISQIGNGLAQIMAGAGTLFTIGGTIYAAIKSSPLASFFRSSATIAASPDLTSQVNSASIDQKAAVVTIADALPQVVKIETTPDMAGRALATAVPSNSVQPTGKVS